MPKPKPFLLPKEEGEVVEVEAEVEEGEATVMPPPGANLNVLSADGATTPRIAGNWRLMQTSALMGGRAGWNERIRSQ